MKKIIISGGNSGIGFEAARQLTALGHHVVILGRDEKKGTSCGGATSGELGESRVSGC